MSMSQILTIQFRGDAFVGFRNKCEILEIVATKSPLSELVGEPVASLGNDM
ncbi:hypothetical protein D3C78_1577000 [compost metagenome]